MWLFAKEWPERRSHWMERFAAHWHDELKLGLNPDGLADMAVRVSLADNREVPLRLDEATVRPDPDGAFARRNLQSWLILNAAKSGYFAAHIAASAALLADAVPWMREQAQPTVECVLHGVDLSRLTWAIDPDGKQLPEGQKHYEESLPSKAITAWLLAYWTSRRIGLIEAEA